MSFMHGKGVNYEKIFNNFIIYYDDMYVYIFCWLQK